MNPARTSEKVSTMRIHYLQHVPFEGPGFIDEWAIDSGYRLSGTALYAGEAFPDVDSFDLLTVLGGPMGVNDASEHNWLTSEKKYIETALRQNKRILGICLGAQLVADVLGARVFKNQHREIGWYPVAKTATAEETHLTGIIPDQFDAFHWHGDTFDLPTGAIHLAQSEACRHQAFLYPPSTIGLQFHLESTRGSIEMIMDHCPDDLPDERISERINTPYVQSRAQIQSREDLIAPSNRLMCAILDHLMGAG